MNALTTIERALSPAQKAWQTRRAHGWTPKPRSVTADVQVRSQTKSQKLSSALAAFEAAADAPMPDWHAVALQLRAAVNAKAAPKITTVAADRLPAPRLDDYPVTSWRKLMRPGAVIVCRFDDGQLVRMSFASIEGQPINIGRGLRLAIAAYRFRIAGRRLGRNRIETKAKSISVPEITACTVERDDVEVARYDLELVNHTTRAWREAIAMLTDERRGQ